MLVVEKSDEQRVRNGLTEYYRELGFTMKVEPTVYDLERVEFCQTRPVLIGSTYRMVRNLHQSLSKDLHCIHDISQPINRDAWVNAVGEGGRVMNDGVPVLMEFFKRFPSLNSRKSFIDDKLEEDRRYKFNRAGSFTNSTPSDETRYSFWLAFGLTPDEQIALEKGFPKLNRESVLVQIQEVATLLQFSGA
jgi:hypothetical protein